MAIRRRRSRSVSGLTEAYPASSLTRLWILLWLVSLGGERNLQETAALMTMSLPAPQGWESGWNC
jgi:hypothetical protein